MYRLLLVAAFLPVPVLQQPVFAEDIANAAMDKVVDVAFSEFEKEVIDRYFRKDREVQEDSKDQERKKPGGKKGGKSKKGLPPGLAKKDELPPGLARQLEKHGSLPAGLAKRDLPEELEKQLPEAPKGYERQVVEDAEDAAVVLIEKATGKVADIIRDAIVKKQ